MERSGPTVNDLRPLIKSFFGGITEEQCSLLKQGSPDNATEVLLVEFLLEIIAHISDAVVARLQPQSPISEQDIHDNVNDSLCLSFAQELKIDEADVPCTVLTNHIVREVTASVNSSIADSEHGDLFINQHVTPPSKLTIMAHQAGKMIKAILTKVRWGCMPRLRKSRSNLSGRKEAFAEVSPKFPSPVTIDELLAEAKSKTPPKKLSSPDSAGFEVSKLVEDILKTTLTELTDPLMDTADEPEYERQRSESFSEIVALGQDIVSSLLEESLTELRAESPIKEKIRLSKKVKNFFAKKYTKTLICRLVNRVKTEYPPATKVGSESSMEDLLDGVEDLIPTEDDIKALCVSVPNGNNQVLTKLNELVLDHIEPEKTKSAPYKRMYAYIVNRVRTSVNLLNWWSTQQLGSQSEKVILAVMAIEENLKMLQGAEEDAVRCEEDQISGSARKSVQSQRSGSASISVERQRSGSERISVERQTSGSAKISVQSQRSGSAGGSVHSPRPGSARKSVQSQRPGSWSSAQSETAARRFENIRRNKMLCNHLVVKVMSQMFVDYESYESYTIKQEAITKRLTERTEAAAEKIDWVITPKRFDLLYKAIFKALCKYSGSEDMFVFSAISDDAGLEDFVVDTVTSHMASPPKKRNAISRFFSSVGKVLTKPFRC